jgi:hypothetical protein
MPTFGVKPIRHWNTVLDHALLIYLEEDEIISDELLSMVQGFTSLCFTYKPLLFTGRQLPPLKITCSAEGLGCINPKSLYFCGVIEELDDTLFNKCSLLENVWFGASTRPLLEEASNLMKCPLKYLGVNGYGIVHFGKGLEEVASKIKTNKGIVEYVY